MTGSITRRRFVAGAAATGAAIVAPEARADGTRAAPSADVVVVGAGLAGLTAARAIHRVGVPVIVLEARTRAGGR